VLLSLVDPYAGFTLYSAWIAYRKRSWTPSILWVELVMTLGFFAASLYALIALQRGGGEWGRFWLGKGHKHKQLPYLTAVGHATWPFAGRSR
jgi:hypothetical protein